MIELRDKDKNRVAGLVDYENLCIESVLESGDKTLSFYYPKKGKYYDEIVEEAYIRTKKDEFVVKARELDDEYTKFECSLNLEELEGNIFDRFESVEQTITSALNLAVVGTGWTVKDNTLKKRRTVRCTNKSSLEIVREIKKVYRVDIVFNTLGKQIEVYEHLGEDKGTYFIDSLNLIALQVQSDSRQYATRIIAEGKDGLSFSDINNGKNYVENYQYSNKVKTIYWKDERYSVKENLLEDARAKLEELSKPFRSYSASILNLAELNPRYSSILDFKLGDAINLISKKNKIKDKQRIVKTIEWPQDHTKDSVELANATLKFEDIQQENQETTSTVNNITVDDGTIDGSTIDGIKVKQIEDFKANVVEVVNLKAINASIDNLHANKADIQDLHAVTAKIGTLEVTKANITQLNAVNAEISKLNAIKANVTDLNAAAGKINVLESKTASIDNLLAGNLTANNFKANSITATSGIIADGAIGSAQISSLSVNKLEAGDITTSKHRIVSADGTIEIVGNQILINRNNINRVILGEYRKLDNTTDYGLLIRGKDGRTVMFDSDGVHNAGITDGAIDNNKVADNANISGNKLDINSVIREVNNNGTETIKGTKVAVGDRTLDVEMSTQKNTITEHSKELSSQKATIQALDSAIKLKVDSQTFTQSTQTINSNINRAKEQAIIGARSIPDTRNDNQSPGWYIEHYPFQSITEFKYSNVIQIPNGGYQYGTLETKVPWNNSSGGYPTQVFRSNSFPTYQRHGINETTWSSWEQIEDTQGSQAKANSALSNAKSYSDSKKQEAISSANSHADNKANEALNNAKAFVNAEITTVNSHLNKATAEINVLKEKIELKVGQSDIDKSIEDVKFGDRNLFPEIYLGSHGCAMGKWNNPYMNIPTYNIVVNRHNQGNNFGFNIKKPIKINGGKGVTFTFLFNYIINKYINNHSSNMHGYTRVYYKDGSKQDFDFNSKIVNCNDKSNWGKWISLKFTFTTDINKEIDNIGLFYFYTDGASEGTNFDFTIPKLVIGNKIGDWTPAPEDTDQLIIDNIKTVTDKISTVESKFTQENNSIKASVQDLNSTTQSITTNVSNINRDLTSKINSNLNVAKSFATDIATNKANTAKQEAISSANNIASSKAAEALNNAKAYTNAEITTINSKVHNVESNLNILSDKINTKVSQSDVDKSISEMKFNDVNMIINSGRFENINHWGITNGNQNLLIKDKVLVARFNNYASWGLYVMNDSLKNKKLDVTKDYTVVCKLKASKELDLNFQICDGGSQNRVYSTGFRVTNDWKLFKFTFKPEQIGNERQFRFIISNKGYDFDLYIDFVKMVEGKISSDVWSPAPEDTNDLVLDNIKVVDTKISDVSSSITQLRDSVTTQINSINSKTHSIETTLGSKASKQEVTEVNNRVATIKASLDGITQRVSATESKTQTLETNLNGKASKQEVNNVSSKVVSLEANLNGITNRVSSTESRINSLNGQVQNAATKQEFTEFKQTSKNFQAKVEEGNGGNNLIVNSGFHGLEGFFQTEYKWNGVNSSVNIWGDSSEWIMNGTNALVIRGTNGSYGAYGARQEGIKLKPNTTYTLSGYAAAHRGKWRISLAKNNWEWLASSRGNSMGGKNPDKWDRFVITFRTSSDYSNLTSCKLDLMLEEAQNDSYAFFSNIMLNEGNFALPWQPKSYEIYGNTMIVDADKLKCSFEDNSYVQMGRNGFEWWKNGMAHPYHCLVTQGVINHLSFNGGNYHHRVYLPPEFRGKHFMIQTMIQGWNFPSGSVSGTMASGYQDADYANGQFTIYFNGGGDWKTNCNIAYVVIA